MGYAVQIPRIAKIRGAIHRYNVLLTPGPMMSVYNRVRKAARHNGPVLLVGEKGVGKEMMAREIYMLSVKGYGFEYVCGHGKKSPDIDRELYGKRRQSSDDASKQFIGSFSYSRRGMMYLDGIDFLDVASQEKLLRVINSGEFMPENCTKVMKTNARIIAGTSEDLAKLVRKGCFRHDLYERMSEYHEINIPSLRRRIGELGTWLSYFLSISPQALTKKVSFSQESMDVLTGHIWHENLDELKNFAERALTAHGVQIPEGQNPGEFHAKIVRPVDLERLL